MSGKGSSRRIENTKKVEKRLGEIDWTKRDKSKDSFTKKVNGKVIENDDSR